MYSFLKVTQQEQPLLLRLVRQDFLWQMSFQGALGPVDQHGRDFAISKLWIIRKPLLVNMNLRFKKRMEDWAPSDKSRLGEFNIRSTDILWNKIPRLHQGAKRLECIWILWIKSKEDLILPSHPPMCNSAFPLAIYIYTYMLDHRKVC